MGNLAGLAASVGLAESVYGVSANVILDSACRAITSWDIVTSCIKAWVFGTIIAVVRALHPPKQLYASAILHLFHKRMVGLLQQHGTAMVTAVLLNMHLTC